MPRDKRGEKPEWYPLDNAGVLYSALQKEKYSAIYRFSAVMAERVDRDALQRAVDKTMPRFPSFGVRIKKGAFWYYFEPNSAPGPFVKEDISNPCQPVRFREDNGWLVRFYYYEKRISVEVFHAVSDGGGALVFFKTLLAVYLRELGYDEELAEERAIAAMGEPDEVGRELNRQYTGWGWVLVSRAAVVLTVVLCAQALLALGILGMVIDSISARIYPNEPSAYTAVAATERLDIRIPVGNDILRVYRISIGQADDTPGVWEAEVQLCAYDRIPGGIVSRRLMEQTWLETPGGRRDPPKGSGRGNWRVEYGSCYVRLSPEDTYVVLRFEAFDEQIRLELPLPEQEGL